MKDLATAFVKVLDNEKASRQVYNISGERFVTFDGIAKACAAAAGAPEPELVHYNPKDFDFGGKKAFPLRDQHFFTSIAKVTIACLSHMTLMRAFYGNPVDASLKLMPLLKQNMSGYCRHKPTWTGPQSMDWWMG